MLFRFSNKKREKAPAYNAAQEKIAENIVTAFIRWQQSRAIAMQRKTEQLSKGAKLIMLLVFCVLAGGYSMYLLTESLSGKHLFSLSIKTFVKPSYMVKSGDENVQSSAVITKEVSQRIEAFKRYMDSLARSPTGARIHDSILAIRPGLMDSIHSIENMYQSQLKK